MNKTLPYTMSSREQRKENAVKHKHVVMFSSGAASWCAAKRVADTFGTDGLTLLFADTLIEDEDNYRFLDQAAASIGGELVTVTEGRSPWEVFRDVRFLGNTRVDPCSKILKRDALDRWLKDNCDPAHTTVYVGLSWDEEHRAARVKARLGELGWQVEAPLLEAPFLTKPQMLATIRQEGIEPPRLYAMGFPHANCGGFCVKAGQAHFRNLYVTMPERYAHHEGREQELRRYLGKDVSILRDRRGGAVKPLTLRSLRGRIEGNGDVDMLEWGGCGCFGGDGENTHG